LLIEPGCHFQTSKQPGIAYELYDLQNDPAERTNVSKQNPEMVEQLAKACADWQERNGIVDYADILKIRPDHMK
jgi:hypothetical protein